MNNRGGYFAQSWALLTKDRGWIKPLLVLGAALLVPVVGMLGVMGYACEWARLTAWGVDAAPKQRGVRVGECIKSGGRMFVVTFVYGLVAGLATSTVTLVLGNNVITNLLGSLVTFVVGFVATIAGLRATIYQSVSAGFQLGRVQEMIERDTNGCLHVAAVSLLMTVALGFAISALSMVALVPVAIRLSIGLTGFDLVDLQYLDSTTARYVFSEFFTALGAVSPLLAVISYVSCVGSALVTLLSDTVVALWMRQFDVPSWGASGDPLPLRYPALPPASTYAAYGQDPYVPPAQSPYVAPGQNPYAAPGQPTYQQPQAQQPYQPQQPPVQPYQQPQAPYQAQQPQAPQPNQQQWQPNQQPAPEPEQVVWQPVAAPQSTAEAEPTITAPAVAPHEATQGVFEPVEEQGGVFVHTDAPEPVNAPEGAPDAAFEPPETFVDAVANPVEGALDSPDSPDVPEQDASQPRGIDS